MYFMPEISEKDMFQVTENILLLFVWRAGLNSVTILKNKSWLKNYTVCNCETGVKISDKACVLLLLRLGKLRLLEQFLSGTW